jgi:DNA topoisomerase-1
VDVDNQFQPLYIVTPEKKGKVSELRDALKSVDELLLATDPDREGEAIAWHLLDTLKPKVPVRRMVFHEITEPAIRAAAANLRDLDQDLVDAQETRRILDRLYGYEVSPVLWKKVMPRLSAGRVQSVATRIIVQRERERMAFVAAGLLGHRRDAGRRGRRDDRARSGPGSSPSTATAIATGRDFGPTGSCAAPATAARCSTRAAPRRLAEALHGRDLAVTSVESRPYTRKPYAPFMTSTLQQEASRKLRFSAERTMRSAQRLYENGYITYMRTDSTTLSESAINAARAQARELYGDAYVSPTPRQYTAQGQERAGGARGHPAVRGDVPYPGQVAREVDGDDFRLYELIWQRTVASQMADARGTTVSVRITGTAGNRRGVRVRRVRAHDHVRRVPQGLRRDRRRPGRRRGGRRRVAPAGADPGPGADRRRAAARRPHHEPARPLHRGEPGQGAGGAGIGRPSTYASIIKTIQDRGYVWKKGSALVPSWIAFAVIGLLEHHFGRLVDYDFTAAMEDELDSIASGTDSRTAWLNGFYFGGAQGSEGSVAAPAG